jgi:hypothetical protein
MVPPEGSKAEGVIVLTNAIKDMGALTTLILKDNKLLTREAGKVLSGMLAANTVLKELDVSSNTWMEHGRMKGDGPGFAKELAVGISGNGALTSLNLSSNNLEAEGAKIVGEVIKVNDHAIAVILAPFSCPSDHGMNCCCFLLSTGHGGAVDSQSWGEQDSILK